MFCFKSGLETCAFWRPKLYENTWKQDGCRRKKDQSDNYRLICECDHLTAFAVMDISRDLVRLKSKNARLLRTSSCTIYAMGYTALQYIRKCKSAPIACKLVSLP